MEYHVEYHSLVEYHFEYQTGLKQPQKRGF